MKLKTYRKGWLAGYSAFCILFSIFGMWLAKVEYGYWIDTFLSIFSAVAIAGIIPFGLLYYAIGGWMCHNIPTTQKFQSKFLRTSGIVKNIFTIFVIILLIFGALLVISPELFAKVVHTVFFKS